MIRNLIEYIIAGASLLAVVACSGYQEELKLSLTSSVAVLPADGKTEVVFSVFEGRADVTASSVIYDSQTGTALKGNTFSTSAAGEYLFHAIYAGKRTDDIKVTAEQVATSQFVRKVCLMEFTDGSCSFCPDASRYIDRNILGKNKDVHLMAFHEKDEWKSEQFATLFGRFGLTGTPSASVDMRGGISLETGGRDNLKTAVAESVSAYPAHCGVAVSSSVDAQGKVRIAVKLYSESSSDYYLAVYVVEDGIRGYQLDGSIGYDDYYHQFVVRQMLSATVYGDSMGRMVSGTEKTQEYVVDCSKDWNTAKTYVYALAIDSEGYVNNMQVCLIDGGNADYERVN